MFAINLPLWIRPKKADAHEESWILTFYLRNKPQNPDILKMCVLADIQNGCVHLFQSKGLDI